MYSVLLAANVNIVRFSFSSEDAYRIDAEVDGEAVGLDILDTAGQVRNWTRVVISP